MSKCLAMPSALAAAKVSAWVALEKLREDSCRAQRAELLKTFPQWGDPEALDKMTPDDWAKADEICDRVRAGHNLPEDLTAKIFRARMDAARQVVADIERRAGRASGLMDHLGEGLHALRICVWALEGCQGEIPDAAKACRVAAEVTGAL